MKKLISVLLSLLLVLIPALSLPAAAEEIQIERDIPEINVHGFNDSFIFKDKDDPEKGYIWNWTADDILGLVKSALPSLAKFSFTWDWDKLADELIPLFQDFFQGAIAAPDGSPDPQTSLDFTYPPASEITSSSKVYFFYDWRADPIESAKALNDFIDYVLVSSGAEQVTLTCHSLGGVITTSYAALYGDEKIRSVCYNATAVYGETYTGELLTGQMTLNADALQAYLEYAFDSNDYQKLLNGIVKLLNDVGLLDFICDFGNLILEKLSPRALPEVVVPLFAGMPTIWAMVPDEFVDDAIDYVFNVVYKDSEADHSGLLEKIQNYNTLVRANKTETLRALNDHANMYVISRYGYSAVPLTPSYKNVSDGLIDAKYASFGATVADYGSTLSKEYLASADEKYISPDEIVDASTCLFPDRTWFVKSLPHGDKVALTDFIDLLLYTEDQATIDTYKQFPQWLKYDYKTAAVSPLTKEDVKTNLSLLDKVKKFFTDFFSKIKRIFASIFNFTIA